MEDRIMEISNGALPQSHHPRPSLPQPTAIAGAPESGSPELFFLVDLIAEGYIARLVANAANDNCAPAGEY